jgi:hypothetical protein
MLVLVAIGGSDAGEQRALGFSLNHTLFRISVFLTKVSPFRFCGFCLRIAISKPSGEIRFWLRPELTGWAEENAVRSKDTTGHFLIGGWCPWKSELHLKNSRDGLTIKRHIRFGKRKSEQLSDAALCFPVSIGWGNFPTKLRVRASSNSSKQSINPKLSPSVQFTFVVIQGNSPEKLNRFFTSHLHWQTAISYQIPPIS